MGINHRIRLATFDALHTLIAPRMPIHVQYSETFAPYLGTLEPNVLKQSFKTALRELQIEKPVYKGDNGAEGWWSDVIRRTAVGAGAAPASVDASLHEIVPRLMKRFSSKEGYTLFPDALPFHSTTFYPVKQLRELGIRASVISNADSRIREVLSDLDVYPKYLHSIVLSEDLGVEKPADAIFRAAFDGFCRPDECMHTGDELDCDYRGAHDAGMHALLLRRPGPDGDGERKEPGEDLSDVHIVTGLQDILQQLQ